MTAFGRKLRSRRGASLLLALLFLLICSMVSASILMAAASNAGKHRSNLEEHQTYLALSSAVSLLCDELSAAEYRGQYQYWTTEEIVGYGEDENPITVTRYHLQQLEGIYTGALKENLLSDFDAMFAEAVASRISGTGIINEGVRSGTVLPHTLTLTPDTGTGLDEREVAVQLTVVEESYAIELTATLDGYTIAAELTPTESQPALPAALAVGTHTTEPMKWKIGWITTGGEEAEP